MSAPISTHPKAPQPNAQDDDDRMHVLEERYENVKLRSMVNDSLAHKFSDRAKIMKLTTATLGAVVTSVSFATMSYMIPFWVTGILSLALTILDVVKSWLADEQSHEQHKNAALRFKKLQAGFEELRWINKVPLSVPLEPGWRDWQKEYNIAIEETPFTSRDLWNKMKRKASQPKQWTE